MLAGTCWCVLVLLVLAVGTLVLVGPYGCLLVPVDACRCVLVLIGAYLVLVGACWCLLVVIGASGFQS
jgi:hypothetical protein